jgi:hypothetical protein
MSEPFQSEVPRKPRIGAILAIVLIGGGTLIVWLGFRVMHPAPPPTNSLEDLAVVMKGVSGEIIFGDVNADAPLHTQKVLLDYRNDPEKYRRYARLLDTVVIAERLGEEARTKLAPDAPPIESTALAATKGALDPWNHPYCVSRTKPGIAVVSGGAGVATFDCAKQQVQTAEIAASRKRVFQTSHGEIVVVVRPESP